MGTQKKTWIRKSLIVGITMCLCLALAVSLAPLLSRERKAAKKELYPAIRNEDIQTVSEIIDRYPALANEPYYTHIFYFLWEGNQTNPLDEAIWVGNLDMVKLLMEKGAKGSRDSLIDALNYREFEIAWLLIGKGADLGVRSGRCEETVPFSILGSKIDSPEEEQAEFELVKYVIEQGTSLKPPDCSRDGIKTLLGLAAYYNNSLVVKYLLDEQIYDIDEIANPKTDQRTALMIAVTQRSYDACQVLLDHGADKTITDIDGKTAIDYALELKDERLIAMLSE